MINIPVDESVAFDMYSILRVKFDASGWTSLKIQKEMTIFAQSLCNQLGREKFIEILDSEEFDVLEKENKRLFDTIDRLRGGDNTISAAMIDNANLMRYQAKQALQKKFFGTEMMEVKFTK